jgi:sulfide dehydrogenase [flavocytochrome c] flavoprotein subunit
MSQINRREFLKLVATASSAAVLTIPGTARAGAKGKVVVIGGGFGGATAAKYLRMMGGASVDVTLIEPNKTYTSCPLSNEVISGHREIKSLQVGYDGLKKHGVNVLHDTVTKVDPAKKTVTTQGGKTLAYDALVMSPGVEFNYAGVEGDSEELSNTVIPHAYKAGPQTLLLKKQLESMPDGGKFIIAVPPGPFRCPPGPYERASQVADYLTKKGKTKSKVILLDANDSFSKKGLFEQAWKNMFGYQAGGMLEWVPGASDGKVIKVDAKTMTAYTNFGEHKGDVLNIIPPHTAGKIAKDAGLTNAKGWCEVVPMTMESTVHKDIYPIGDACVAGEMPVYPMPKSAHMAMTQAKVAVGAILAKMNGQAAPVPFYVNTCYSTINPEYGFSVVHVYRVTDNKFVYVTDAGGVSPVTLGTKEAPQTVPPIQRKLEAEYCVGWFNNVMADAFA